MLAHVWVGVLGPTVVASARGGDPVEVRAAKQRALLAALALHAPRPVSQDGVVEAVWGPDAPATAAATLQTYVSVVRRTLEPDLAPRTPSSYLLSVDGGYRLVADTDAAELTTTVNEVHARLGPMVSALVPVADAGLDAAALAGRLEEALATWRGEPYADLPDSDVVRPERVRLEALRVLAQEDRAILLVAAGRDAEAVAELESLSRTHPLRERLWLLLAAALARTGRQADALAALDELRTTLDDELGLEPSRQVNELQTMVLRHEVPRPQAPTSRRSPSPEAVRVSLPAWPLVGRDQHLATLDGLLERTERGGPEFASLVGEPGAGKSRLAAELAAHAQDRGVRVLVGRSSQDEDAPPMWPWRQALGDTVVDEPGSDTDHDAARFAVAESVRRTLADLSREHTVLLVLEDLHWADASSLRVLRHVIAHLETGRLLVLATWRRGSTWAPGGQPLGDVAEALARRHATTLDVTGLDEDDTARLVAELTGDLDPAVAHALHRRTDGNPFFLIEYGRLARDEGRALREALAGVPPTVAAVVTRRIAQLPTPTSAALTAGAVIGREFSVDLLARALESEELALLDLLQPAVDGDLLRDVGGDVFRFGHALARDAAYDALTPSRRERLHALIAGMVEESADAEARSAEVARHWAAAGPRHIRRAWEAAARAGGLAMASHATDEAASHLEAALDLQGRDATGTDVERYDLLLQYADACRWSTRRLEMHQASDAAIVIGAELADPERVVRAASVPTQDALWPARSYGDANTEVVAVLRDTLAGVPVEDSELRCRLLLVLASEGYYLARPAETDRLVEEAVSMARRIAEASGDPRLLADSLLAAVVAWWRPDRAGQRQALLGECLRLSEEHDFERLAVNVRCLLVCGRCELGDVDGLVQDLAEVAELAREHRLYFAELIVTGLAHSWSVMRGDVPAAQAHLVRLAELDEQISLAHKQDALRGVAFNGPLWFRDLPIDLEQVGAFQRETTLPLASGATALFLRHGLVEQARAVWSSHEFDEVTVNWYSPPNWAFSAEAAVGLGDHEVGAAVYSRLRPYAGRCVMSGTNPALGPVDAYLALAAAATGDIPLATEHAEQGLEQTRAWGLPQVEEWLLELRERHGF